MHQSIIKAIHEKKLITLIYSGLPRIVEPHAYGVSTKGNDILRCYQVRGEHTSDIPHEWNLFTVSKIIDLGVLQDGFSGPRPGYNRDDKAMTTIYAQL